ncbi:hypothetical protein BDY21DRAFT_338538 [Lineolata rhizophorae]|uniref:Uncharacterized protein n=1 Tax=Lineolata rhizophorae TaxID=578093 RepID=A0A6A6P6B9_9PEZI|nr:hypothetical protein BDY21DRAFT_338538 [Lineolata rhizophorae]
MGPCSCGAGECRKAYPSHTVEDLDCSIRIRMRGQEFLERRVANPASMFRVCLMETPLHLFPEKSAQADEKAY